MHLKLISSLEARQVFRKERKNHSTLDHIFELLNFYQIHVPYSVGRKKIVCAFVVFKQAFDTVWRNGLWYKLLDDGIGENVMLLFKMCTKELYLRFVWTICHPMFFCGKIGVNSFFIFYSYYWPRRFFYKIQVLLGYRVSALPLKILYLKFCLLFNEWMDKIDLRSRQ